MKHTDACRGANAGSGCGCICGAQRRGVLSKGMTDVLFWGMLAMLALFVAVVAYRVFTA